VFPRPSGTRIGFIGEFNPLFEGRFRLIRKEKEY